MKVRIVDSSDARHRLLHNCGGDDMRDNYYGKLLSTYEDVEYPIMCGCGGSMYLCKLCYERMINEPNSETSS